MTNTNPSGLFLKSLLGGAGHSVYCSCGKDHESLKEYPEHSWVEYVELDGNIYVCECDGCMTRLARYEQFIWNSRKDIHRYLSNRIDHELQMAQQERLQYTLRTVENAFDGQQ